MKNPASKSFIHDFTSGPVLSTLLTFSFPLFLSNLLQAIYNVVDMIIVGQIVGETGLSALSIGGDISSLLTFVSMGFSTAGQVVISQYIGAGLREKLSKFVGTMFTFMLLCAVGMSVLCLLLREQLLTLMNTPFQAWDQALAYSTTCACGMVFIYGYNIVSAILRGMGDSKRPLMFIAIAAVLNLVLDIWFVARLDLGAFGAALATVIAQAISFLTALVYLYRKRDYLGFDFAISNFRMDRVELSILIKMGVPFAIRSAAVHFSKLFVNSWINSYGVTISAVTGAAYKVDMFANLMGVAINTAGSSMVGQNIGAEKYDRVPKILGAAYMLTFICFAAMITIICLFPSQVFGLFINEVDVLLVCLEYVPISVVNFVCSALRDGMNTFTGGCGNYKYNFAVAIIDGLIARIVLSLLFGLWMGMGYFGFWLGNAVAGVTPFVLGVIYYLSGRWKRTSDILA